MQTTFLLLMDGENLLTNRQTHAFKALLPSLGGKRVTLRVLPRPASTDVSELTTEGCSVTSPVSGDSTESEGGEAAVPPSLLEACAVLMFANRVCRTTLRVESVQRRAGVLSPCLLNLKRGVMPVWRSPRVIRVAAYAVLRPVWREPPSNSSGGLGL